MTLQSPSANSEAGKDNLCTIGGICRVIHSVRLTNGDLKVRLHVQGRGKVNSFISFSPVIRAKVQLLEDSTVIDLSPKEERVIEQVREKLSVLSQYDSAIEDHVAVSAEIFDPGALADLAASVLPLQPMELQRVLEELDRVKRLKLVEELLNSQIDVAAIKERIASSAQKELGRMHHEELLREQLRQLQAELGDSPEYEDELSDLKKMLGKSRMPAAVKKEAEKQLRRLQQLHPDTSEAALARTYLDWILDLPWSKRTVDRLDLKRAQKILDEDHFGLDKTKERILDFLGVRKLRKEHRGPILLLVGPPGVGKTSLGRSIAKALGRKFVRVSVGGLRDEAELRGHRRTYVGALPGRVVQGLKTAGTKNPVFMLDEIDKIGSDYRGDPSSVLLEVLDPEQNKEFEDHYLNVPFDLSEVMFIATANMTDSIPSALLDRMEIIELSGYTTEEKLQIARRYLIPQEKEENGLKDISVRIPDQVVLELINGYTRESGVRELRRTISTIFRKVARTIAEEKREPKVITSGILEKYLGPIKFFPDKRPQKDEIGVVTGLAWTSVGGELLPIEVTVTKGKGSLSLTGQMGEVMRESGMAALTWVMSKAESLGIDPNFYESSNVHVHVPQGAIPKDGPSAGTAIATAMVSILTGRPISSTVAMTGEITLRGSVLPIGGLKEKALAALRVGIRIVIIPKENYRETREFPKYLLDKVTFVPVEGIEEVLAVALSPKPEAVVEARKPKPQISPTARPIIS